MRASQPILASAAPMRVLLMLGVLVAALGASPPGAATAAPRFKLLHVFDPGAPDLGRPLEAPTRGADGALYGTAASGLERYPFSDGGVYRIDRAGTYAILHEFRPDTGESGGPSSALALGPDGLLYGTASGTTVACGSVYRIDPQGATQVVHEFHPDEMCQPRGRLALGADGALYGTATATHGRRVDEGGAVFRIAPDRQLRVLHEFGAERLALGTGPNAGVVSGADGALYGTTVNGGAHHGGTLFRLGLDGSYTVLHAFHPSTEGQPSQVSDAPLILGRDGLLYGALGLSGPGGCGSLYRTSLAGDFELLHVFHSDDGRGCGPSGGLMQASDGAFYGTAQYGGPTAGLGRGVVFRLAPSGRVAVLHVFDVPYQGEFPVGGVTELEPGLLVGVTQGGGSGAGDKGLGVVWALQLRD